MLNLDNKLQIENAIKAHPVLAARIRSLTLNYKKFLELLHLAEHNAAREVISFYAYRFSKQTIPYNGCTLSSLILCSPGREIPLRPPTRAMVSLGRLSL